MTDPITIRGLDEFRNNLKAIDRELPKALRLAFNVAADIIVAEARPKVPAVSGAARSTVKAKSTQTSARVQGGSAKVPYYPWLDFGGRVGKSKSVRRPFLREGRYIYDAYFRNKPRFGAELEKQLLDVVASAGIEVD